MSVSPYDVQDARRMLDLKPGQPYPEDFLARYEKVRQLFNKVTQGSMGTGVLASIIAFDLLPAPEDTELPPNPENQKIHVRYYKRYYEGRFIRKADDGQFEVALNPDPKGYETRIVDPAKVTFLGEAAPSEGEGKKK